ncbi:hypothetical protein ACTXOW_06940 [Corynebacterium variabile]|uniref:hypothetical protein n=1 Tax=Corynebacterium variabile TaxID=1727 RepID=UPI003FD60AAC
MKKITPEQRIQQWLPELIGVTGEPTDDDLDRLVEVLVESPRYEVWIEIGQSATAHYLPDGSAVLEEKIAEVIRHIRKTQGEDQEAEIHWSGPVLEEVPTISDEQKAEVERVFRICYGPTEPMDDLNLQGLYSVLEETPWKWRRQDDGEPVQVHKVREGQWIPRAELAPVVAGAAEMVGMWRLRPVFYGKEIETGIYLD